MKKSNLKVMDERKKIGSRIAQIRESKGISRAQLGKITGISEKHVERIELGLYDVKFSLMSKISSALECSMDDFIK